MDEEPIQKALDDGDSVEIVLRLGAAELFALPWECLSLGESGRHVSDMPRIALRYTWPGTKTTSRQHAPLPTGDRYLDGRILFADATYSPENAVPWEKLQSH